MELKTTTYQSKHCPITPLNRSAVFTELFTSADGKIVKKRIFPTKSDWLIWKKSLSEEITVQSKFSQAFPENVLTMLDYSIEIVNHKRFMYITYDCDSSSQPLFKYIYENDVSHKEQVNICEQLLLIARILHKSEYFHANLKPNNVIYYNKRVLITDFGSARTHHLNFTKEHTGQKEKEWRNSFLFFCPQQYLEIMNEENLDFRDDQWKKINLNDSYMRKRADIWAIGIMMLQVFENKQNLNQKIDSYYGLNNEFAIEQKLKSLGESQGGLVSNAIKSLILQWQDPDFVLKQFYKQKSFINQEKTQLLDTTSFFYPVFDEEQGKLLLEKDINQNYCYSKAELERLQQRHDTDDVSSVRSTNVQIIENTKEAYAHSNQREGSLFKSNQLIPENCNEIMNSQQLKRLQNQPVEFRSEQSKSLENFTEQQVVRKGNQKPSIVITSCDQGQFPQWQVGQLELINEDEEKQTLLGIENRSSTNNISQNNQSQKLVLITDEEPQKQQQQPPSFQMTSQQFQLHQTGKLQKIADENKKDDLISFNNFESSSFQFGSGDNQNNTIQLEQFNDQNLQQPGKIDQWNNYSQEFGNVQGLNLAEVNDITNSKSSLISINQVERSQQQFDAVPQPSNFQPFEETIENKLVIQQSSENLQNFSAYFPGAGNLEPVKDEASSVQQREPNPKIIDQFGFNKQTGLQVVQDDNNQFEVEPPKSAIKIDKLQRQEQPLQLQPLVDNNQKQVQQSKINDPQVNKFQPVQDLRNLNDEELKQQKEQLNQQLEILQHSQQVITNLDEENSDQLKSVVELMDEKKKQLYTREQQEKLQQVIQEQLEAVKERLRANQFFQKNEMENNPQLLSQLSDQQLKQLKETLKTKNDPKSLEMKGRIEQLEQVNQKFDAFINQPQMKNLLKPDDLEKLNPQQLKQYNEELEKIAGQAKPMTQKNQIYQQQQQIKKLLAEKYLDSQVNKFRENPQSGTLLTTEQIKQLNENQQNKYIALLKDQLPVAQGRFKKALEQALLQIDELQKLKSQFRQIENPQPEIQLGGKLLQPVDKNVDRKEKNLEKVDLDIQRIDKYEKTMSEKQMSGGGAFTWNDEAFDFEVFSLNPIICQFQRNTKLYTVQQEIPLQYHDKELEVKERKRDFFNRNTFGGYWKDEKPYGLGTMMEAKKYGIYKGIFKDGIFLWGQVLELNDKGQLTQYIGYYHDKYQVKNGKTSEMKWYRFQNKQFDLQERYIGSFVLGYFQGNGKKYYQDNSEYNGEWKKNQRSGQGTFIKKTLRGYFQYVGDFKNDLYEGVGIVYYDEGKKLSETGRYEHGKPKGEHILKLDTKIQKRINY